MYLCYLQIFHTILPSDPLFAVAIKSVLDQTQYSNMQAMSGDFSSEYLPDMCARFHRL